MPRTLPWEREEPQKKVAKQQAPSITKRKHVDTTDLVDENLDDTTPMLPKRRATVRPARSPSTSPPPAPPQIEFMHEGFDADDRWMMVEDEFFTTAQIYTQHIHHAEYVRLKKLARSRGQDTLNGLARPTDGRTALSDSAKLRMEAMKHAKGIKDGLREYNDDKEEEKEEDEAWRFDPTLAGLMTSESSRGQQELTGLAKPRAKTRAAAGYSQSPHDRSEKHRARQSKATAQSRSLSEDEADGLDGPSIARSKAETLTRHDTVTSLDKRTQKATASPMADGTNIFKRFAAKPSDGAGSAHDEKPVSRVTSAQHAEERRSTSTAISRTSSDPRDTKPVTSSTFDADGSFIRSSQSAAASNFLAKRRAAREKRERDESSKQSKKKDSLKFASEIPTFLI